MKAEMKWKGETRKAEIQNGGRQRYHGFSRRFVARQRGRGLIHYVATALTLEGGFSSVAHTKTRLFCSVPRSGKQWYCYGQQQQQCRPPTTEDTTIASKRKVRFIVYIYIYIYISICKIVQLDESCFSLSRVTREKERKEKYRAASKTKSYFIDRRNVSSGAYLVSNISVSVCLELCNELRPLPSGKSQIARDISVRGEEKGNCRKSWEGRSLGSFVTAWSA